jgi:arylsulfotransferase ASST
MERPAPHLPVLMIATVVAALGACSEKPLGSGITDPLSPVSIRDVVPDPGLPGAAEVTLARSSPDSMRVTYTSADGSEAGATPWSSGTSGPLIVLGLRSATSYNMTVESRQGASSVKSIATTYVTPALPQDLAGMALTLVSGAAPTSGYTLTAVETPSGHAYLVAFDGAGTIRWYRDMGTMEVQDAQQQTNGDFTVFVGNAIGNNAGAGAFIELSPSGDSVRAIAAIGSSYTDGHDLRVLSDATGKRMADYLFGYDIRYIDESGYGGGSSDALAGHQLLRIGSSGTVDTLLQGWDRWTHADKIDPPLQDQGIDHPNSIEFDLDGGVIASFRNLGAVVKIDPATKDVIWQLGGLRNQFTFVGDPLNGFGGQHAVHVLPDGHLLLLDNGVTHTPQVSRVVEYALDLSARTATMVWEYTPSPSMFNEFTGWVQRLSNGNTIVAWTNYGLIDEVAPDGGLVNRMQLNSSAGVTYSSTYRMIRIGNLYHYVHP